MKVALIGDVHANLPALEAVLAHAHQHGVEAIWNVGDFVGYGAFPDPVVKRLRRENALSIVGNYDLKVLKFKKKKKKWRKSKRPEKFLAFEWAYKSLSKKSRKYLRSLPQETRLQAEGWRILLTHGSPASNEEHLTPHTPEERLRELAQMSNADLVICGHSHQPFARKIDGVWFINTGSVGRPDDNDPRACYAILQIEPCSAGSGLQVRHYRVEYDVGRTVAAIREQKLPEAFARMMLQGRDLDTVLEASRAQAAATRAPSPSGRLEGGDLARMKPRIEATAFGSITIDGREIENDVLLRLDGSVKKRKKKLSKKVYGTSHIISLDEAKHVYEKGAELLIIGSGQNDLVRLSDEAQKYLKKRGCRVKRMATPEAIRAWNKAKGKVIGLFHVTC